VGAAGGAEPGRQRGQGAAAPAGRAGPGCDRRPATLPRGFEPVELAYLLPPSSAPELDRAGIVTGETARVRLVLHRDGLQAPPVEVRALDSGGVFPHNRLFVAVLPAGTVVSRIELLDRQGGKLCVQRLVTLRAAGGDGSCF
jgi:hypothetical protein